MRIMETPNPETLSVKEHVYDREIAPLVQQIEDICRVNGINNQMIFDPDEYKFVFPVLHVTKTVPGTANGLSNTLKPAREWRKSR